MTCSYLEKPLQSEDKARQERRDASLAAMRAEMEAAGVAERFILESEQSLRSAFAAGDAFDAIFGGRFK